MTDAFSERLNSNDQTKMVCQVHCEYPRLICTCGHRTVHPEVPRDIDGTVHLKTGEQQVWLFVCKKCGNQATLKMEAIQ